MLAFAFVAVLVAAAPDAALGCKSRKCKLSEQRAGAAGSVWHVTLPNVKKVDDAVCREPAEEWWFIPTGGVAQKLLAVCNDGYGASGVGEDTIDVKGTTFKHSRYGGSAWRWSSETELALSPLRIVRESSTSFHATMPDLGTNTDWNWDTFSGSTHGDVVTCNAEGAPELESEKSVAVQANLIPVVTLPKAFREGGWKTTSLSACSAGATFVTFGKQSGASDASLRVVAQLDVPTVRRELYVEVRDDVFVETAAKWTLADHVELWLGKEAGSWDECAGRKSGSQWGIALDGAVNVGFGAPAATAISVESVKADGVVRMKIVLPVEPLSRVALVYSDSDDGKKQKSLLATSKLKFASVVSMSSWQSVQAVSAVCEVDGASLKPKITRTFEPATAVIE